MALALEIKSLTFALKVVAFTPCLNSGGGGSNSKIYIRGGQNFCTEGQIVNFSAIGGPHIYFVRNVQ